MGTSHTGSHKSYMSSRKAAALPGSARKYGRGQVRSMPMSTSTNEQRTVMLSAPDEDGVAVSLYELQPREALSPGEGNPTHHTQRELYRTIRSLPDPRPAAKPTVL